MWAKITLAFMATICLSATSHAAFPLKTFAIEVTTVSDARSNSSYAAELANYIMPKIRHSSSHHSSSDMHMHPGYHHNVSLHYHYHTCRNTGYSNYSSSNNGYRHQGNAVAGILSVVAGAIGLTCILIPNPVDAVAVLAFCGIGSVLGIVGLKHKLSGVAIAGLTISLASAIAVLVLAL